MDMTRRTLLLGGLSFAALMSARFDRVARAAAEWARPGIVLLTGVDWFVNPVRLATIFEPFVLRKIPITIAMAAEPPGSRPDRNNAVAVMLREAIDNDPDLIEVAMDVGPVESVAPYFQLRQASEAQATFTWMLNPHVDSSQRDIVTALTAVSTSPLRSYQDFAAMRAAGVRSVVHLSDNPVEPDSESPAGGYWITDNGLANVFGRQFLSDQLTKKKKPAAPWAGLQAADIDAFFRGVGKGDEPAIVRLRFEEFAELGDADLAAAATGVAVAVREATDSQYLRAVLPWILYTQSRPEAARYVVLRVDSGGADAAAARSLVDNLVGNNFAVTESVSAGSAAAAQVSRFGKDARFDLALFGAAQSAGSAAALAGEVAVLEKASGRPIEAYVDTAGLASGDGLDGVADAGLTVLSGNGNGAWLSGMDSRGLVHMSNTVGLEAADGSDLSAKEVLERIGRRNDVVLAIDAAKAASPAKRQVIREVLASISGQPGTTLTNLGTYVGAAVPPMPVPEQIRYARVEVRIRDRKPGAVDAAAEARLLSDAELAWQFFAWGATQFKGMVPGTAWLEYGNKAGYPFATQWDFGSYVQATIAAHRLKIIDQPTFETTINTILKFLAKSSYPFRGVRLPDVERGLGKDKPKGRGFDSADTGRLLIALRGLENYAPKTFPTKKLVASWGLQSIIVDGVLNGVSNGSLVAIPHNSYSHYARQGYLAWGFDVAPIYEDLPLDMDGSVRLIDLVASRGRVATEPTVTEEIEVGGTAHSRLIADVLYGAQIKRYQKTGILTCISEGPIDGPPYFTYPGYQITPDGGEFVVDGRNLEQKQVLDKLGDKWRMVSTKGCYLWYAARPGAYSDLLLEHARIARIEGLGFASGIHETDGTATALTDVNTNALILESIAFVLGGRKALMTVDAQVQAAN